MMIDYLREQMYANDSDPDVVVVYDMENSDYHAARGLSRSRANRAPLHVEEGSWTGFVEGAQLSQISEPLQVGSALHTLVLEPDRWHKDVRIFTGGKTRNSQAFRAYAHAALPQVTLTKSNEEDVKAWAAALRRHLEIDEILNRAERQEVSVFWTHEPTGLRLKARLDLCFEWDGNTCIGDIKTAKSAGHSFMRDSFFRYGYYLQPPWYTTAARKAKILEPSDRDAFAFLVVDKTTGDPRLEWTHPEWWSIGYRNMDQLLENVHQFLQDGTYVPGQGYGTTSTPPPTWIKRRYL